MDEEVYTDFSITSATYLSKYTGLWWPRNAAEEGQRRISVVYMTIALVYGIYVNVVDTFYTWGDTSHCMFLILNATCIGMAIIKMLILSTKRAEFGDVVLYAQRHFWHRNYDSVELMMFSSCAKYCTWFMKFILVAVPLVLSGYVITPIVANHGRNKSERILPFKMWVDWPLTETPYYELMFIFQASCIYLIGVAYIGTDMFVCLLNLHVVYQFRILQYRLLNFWNVGRKEIDANAYCNHCYAALKRCIQYHQSIITFCQMLENVYTMPILVHMAILSLLMGFDCYEIAVADVEPFTRLIFLSHLIGSTGHLLMLTYTCHYMMEESMNITTAVYLGYWSTLPVNKNGRSFRTGMKFIMMRSLKPCCLTAGGFFPVTLEAFTTILSSAFSYFTLMRQSFMRTEGE